MSGLSEAARSTKVPFSLTILRLRAKARSNRVLGIWPFAEARCRKNHPARLRTGSAELACRITRDRREDICCASSGPSAVVSTAADTKPRKPRRCLRLIPTRFEEAPPTPPVLPTRSDKNHHPAADAIVTKNSQLGVVYWLFRRVTWRAEQVCGDRGGVFVECRGCGRFVRSQAPGANAPSLCARQFVPLDPSYRRAIRRRSPSPFPASWETAR